MVSFMSSSNDPRLRELNRLKLAMATFALQLNTFELRAHGMLLSMGKDSDRANARRLGIPARFHQGDLFAALPRRLAGAVDVVTLHPPYVGKRELRELPLEVLRFEPVDSLTDHSPRGLGLIGRVALEAPVWLKPDGWVLIEVSPDRARAVATVLRRAGYSDVRSTKGGLAVTRVITGRGGRRARSARQRA